MSPFEELVSYAVKLCFDDLPIDIIHFVKRSLVLTLANCAEMAEDSTITQLAYLGSGVVSERNATVVGLPDSPSASWAAFVYGYASHHKHKDDYHRNSLVSPTSPVASTLLALTQHHHVSGQELLLGLALGTEIAVRTGLILGFSHRRRGWYPTATAGYVGAIAGGAKIRKFDVPKFTNALGLGSLATGTVSFESSHGPGLTVGRAAYSATSAVLLAENGFTSNLRAIEGPKGFLSVSNQELSFKSLTNGLGDIWNVLESTFKPMPCDPELYPALVGASLLGTRLGNNARQIRRVDVTLADISLDWIPENGSQSVGGLTETLCRMIETGSTRAVSGNVTSVNRSQLSPVQNIGAWEVYFHKNDQFPLLQAQITATLSDGTSLSQVMHSTHPVYQEFWTNPSDDQISHDFINQVSRHVGSKQATGLLDSLWHLEQVGDMMKLLAQ